jgi:RHS repeat-associated protein
MGRGKFSDVNTSIADSTATAAKRQAVLTPIRNRQQITTSNVQFFAYLGSLTNRLNDTSECYFYHPDHLGSSSWITDSAGAAVQHLHYLPFGETFVSQRSADFDAMYTFSAKEKDTETGYSYFGARYYSSDLSIWLSVDPMSDKYPSLSPYTYCADNPVKLVDPNGEEISTHTDKNGNVLAVYNDGQLGIYVHTQAEIDAFIKGVKFQNDVNQLKGHTLCVSSFSVGDKIDFESFQANRWFNIFKGMFSHAFASPMNAVAYYASEAGNGGLFDPKSKFKNGSQLTEGIYVSPRDLGNYAAGYFGHAVGLSKEFTLASFGAFQLSKNNKVEFLAHFNKYYRQALSTIGIGIEPFQKTYGEAAISNYFQRLGYENINTLDDFNKKYSMIWKD